MDNLKKLIDNAMDARNALFEYYVKEHFEQIYMTALTFFPLSNERTYTAEDATYEVIHKLVNAYQRTPEFTAIRTFISKTTRNHCIDIWRKEKPYRKTSETQDTCLIIEMYQNDKTFESKYDYEVIMGCLSPVEQTIANLRANEFTFPEIAEIMKIFKRGTTEPSPDAVSKRYQRILVKLRQIFGPDNFLGGYGKVP